MASKHWILQGKEVCEKQEEEIKQLGMDYGGVEMGPEMDLIHSLSLQGTKLHILQEIEYKEVNI